MDDETFHAGLRARGLVVLCGDEITHWARRSLLIDLGKAKSKKQADELRRVLRLYWRDWWAERGRPLDKNGDFV